MHFSKTRQNAIKPWFFNWHKPHYHVHANVRALDRSYKYQHGILNKIWYIIWYFCWFGWHAGFENAAVACCSTGMFEMGYACSRLNPFTCNDADKYVFWDAFHPTQKTNSIIAYYVVKKVLAQFLWSIMPKNRCTFL